MNATAAQTKSLEWLNRLRANPKIPLIVAGSAAVAVMVALILWAKAPDYRTLCNQVNHLIPTRVLVKGGEITCKILK
ncbi:hypothetical protein EBP99_004495 [Escherichia coli O157:NM]|nr:hypothetical protein [Escherichia coli O157:NM]